MKKVCRQLVMANRNGLHMRPAAEIAKLAARYDSEIHVSRGEEKADIRSIFELMILGVRHGDAMELHAIGHDAHDALDAIGGLLDSYRDVEVGGEGSVDPEPTLRVA